MSGPTPADRRLKHNATERYRTFLISEKVAELGAHMESIGRKFKNEKLHILGTAVDMIEELMAEKHNLDSSSSNAATSAHRRSFSTATNEDDDDDDDDDD